MNTIMGRRTGTLLGKGALVALVVAAPVAAVAGPAAADPWPAQPVPQVQTDGHHGNDRPRWNDEHDRNEWKNPPNQCGGNWGNDWNRCDGPPFGRGPQNWQQGPQLPFDQFGGLFDQFGGMGSLGGLFGS